MNSDQETKRVSAMFSDEEVLAWMEEHAAEMRRYVLGQRILYQSLVLGFVIGLVAHVGGYVLLLSQPQEPFGLLADLLHALGWSLWTGVVVALFVQVVPEVKRRQIRQALAAYDALARDRARSGDKGGPG